MARNDKAPEAYATLSVLLTDPDSDLREQAAEGLEMIEDERATKQLYSQLKTEKDEWVRDAIISALETLDPDFDEDEWEQE